LYLDGHVEAELPGSLGEHPQDEELLWVVMADARASRRQETDVASGAHRAVAANARVAWRRRSAVTVMPSYSWGTCPGRPGG